MLCTFTIPESFTSSYLLFLTDFMRQKVEKLNM